MPNLAETITKNLRKDHFKLGVVFAVMGTLVLIANFWPRGTNSVPAPLPVAASSTVTSLQTDPNLFPVSLRIPKISVEAAFEEPLGLRSNGEIEVPKMFDTVGWYQHGPVPGSIGPAVVLGHVDSYRGPAVFYSLGQLTEGDEVFITLSGGREARFVVEKSEVYPQSAFPTAEVYGDIEYAGLRLITCSGQYSRSADRYSHNRVVYARLVAGE
ncbi:MAG: class F sortase [Patescibacteria group bacterium]